MCTDDTITHASDRDGHRTGPGDPNWPYPPIRCRIGGRDLCLPSFRPAPGWDDPHPWPIVCWGRLGGRPPDWRWRLGLRRGTPRWAARDPWLGRVRAYRRAAGRAGSPLAPGLTRRHPEVAAACRLRATDDPLRRVELECRLLAGQDDDAVARACGLAPAAVAAYEAAFYAVRARLGCRDWIMNLAVGVGALHAGLGTVEHALKLYAYLGGPLVLESALDAVHAGLEAPAAVRDLRRRALTALALTILPADAVPPRLVVAMRLPVLLARDAVAAQSVATATGPLDLAGLDPGPGHGPPPAPSEVAGPGEDGEGRLVG